MVFFERAVIVGVGLLGGSVGKALRNRTLAKTVVGCGRSAQRLEQAQEAQAIDQGESELTAAAQDADLVVVCTPVKEIVHAVEQCAKVVAPHALITDVGSTKAEIVRQLSGCRFFCGAHPLAGSEKSGVQFSDSRLFEGRTVVLTPANETPREKVEQNDRFWKSMGGITVEMDAQTHDAAVAATSHLPHLLAAALAGATDRDLLSLTASGWQDTTRVAAGNVEMWLQIVDDNREPILQALRSFGGTLDIWIDAIANRDRGQLQALLVEAKQIRDSVGN